MTSGSYQGFDVTVSDAGVATFVFTHPERLNAMSIGTRRDLIEVLELAQLDDSVRVIVITGTGRGFCAGAYLGRDLGDEEVEDPTLVPAVGAKRWVPVNAQAQLRLYAQDLARTVRRIDKVTIAAVNGFAIQLGLSLALACDYVIAADSAKLGSATLRMGYLPDEGGPWLLIQHMGVKRALDFVLRSRIVSASEAHELGLVTEVVPKESLMDHATALAEELARGPQVAMRLLKRAVYNAAELTFDQAGEDIALRTGISDFHPDAENGFKALSDPDGPRFNAWLDTPAP
jgi:2-(1,2-epoxy-1,2-dihydrophenyl)acetyl-CoA isomerase